MQREAEEPRSGYVASVHVLIDSVSLPLHVLFNLSQAGRLHVVTITTVTSIYR
jgi:hypothetical protein